MSKSRLIGRLTGLFIAVLVTAFAVPSMAQLRFATGSLQGEFGEFVSPTTTVTTNFGRVCGPGQPCPANPFPAIGGAGALMPVNAAGAVISGGNAVGDPVDMLASQWEGTAMGFIPGGVIPGIAEINTAFEGRNAGGMFSAGGGPGAQTVNPLAASIPAFTYVTNRFIGAMSPFGATAVEPTTEVVTFPALAAAPDSLVRARIVAGPRQFGGAIEVLQDAPGQIIREVGTQNFSHTNARCAPSLAFGECGAGLRVGTPAPQVPQARIYLGTGAGGGRETGHNQWVHTGWTTGTVSVVQRFGVETTFGRTGSDEITAGGARQLQMVTPSINYGVEFQGAAGVIPDGTGMIWTWDILFAPEPVSGAGVMAGVGLLGFLLRKRSHR